MSGRRLRDGNAGNVVRGLQRVRPTQGASDAFPEGIHPPFSNLRVSGLIGATPDGEFLFVVNLDKICAGAAGDGTRRVILQKKKGQIVTSGPLFSCWSG